MTEKEQLSIGVPEYWEARYSKDSSPFEWLQRYEEFAPFLKAALLKAGPKVGKLLDCGCGTSTIAARLVSDGIVADASCVDCSAAVVAARKAVGKVKGVKFNVVDCCTLEGIEDSSFDAVIDKATLDSIACGPQSGSRVASYISSVQRVLRSGGVFALLSWRTLEFRTKFFEASASGWTAPPEVVEVIKPDLSLSLLPPEGVQRGSHWLYVFVKK